MSAADLASAPRAALFSTENAPIFVLLAAVLLVVAATFVWGLPVLAMSALVLVPVIFTLLMMVTRG